MKQKVEVTDSYFVANGVGNNLRVDVRTTFTYFHPTDGTGRWSPGSKEYVLENGRAINVLPNGDVQDVLTNEIFRKI